MEFDNAFDVPLTPSQAWAVLTDIRRVAPCMPGAELTEIVDTRNFKGKIAARLGPVALAFAGNVEFENLDEAKHNARIRAQGNDAKGRGSAYATATFRIEPAGAGSRVLIHTDLMLSGAVAQYGRGVGMIQATAAQIIAQFANNLRLHLAPQPAAQPAPAAVAERQAPSPVAPPPIVMAPPLSPAPPGAEHHADSPSPPATAPLPPAAKPISGFTLLARVIWQDLVGLFTGRKH